ncbi:hypothetical protein P5663_06880 [Priestia flexa]|uniref:hypothetical protein n=1 Tax=Priestia flexa TaxID=86664 RepID=UPI00240D649C|nr:hypothetical protein [Priestia flexa]WEZ09563.1 hypothetical protein P5663_06880 [Priestia flexa]
MRKYEHFKDKYYYCYSPYLQQFLNEKDVAYITIAINPANGNKFALYEITDELSVALTEYKYRSRLN